MTTLIKEETPQFRCLMVSTKSKTKNCPYICLQLYQQAHNIHKRRICWTIWACNNRRSKIDDTEASSTDDNGTVTHSTNSIALKKMLAEQVYPDTFEPSHATQCLCTSNTNPMHSSWSTNHSLHKMKPQLALHALDQYDNWQRGFTSCFPKTIPDCNEESLMG